MRVPRPKLNYYDSVFLCNNPLTDIRIFSPYEISAAEM